MASNGVDGRRWRNVVGAEGPQGATTGGAALEAAAPTMRARGCVLSCIRVKFRSLLELNN